MDPLTRRIVARFIEAARAIVVSPFKMAPCSNCGGEGTYTEDATVGDVALQVKALCARCFGTGTDPKSLGALRKEAEDLAKTYEADKAKFEAAKEAWGPGRSNPSFGRWGYKLQTLKAKVDGRQKQLKQEDFRQEMGKKLARVAGAAASR